MRKSRRFALLLVSLLTLTTTSQNVVAQDNATPQSTADQRTIRVATYNTSLFRRADGELISDLESGTHEQAKKIAEVIQRVRPDVMLCNEFDYDEAGRAAKLFQEKYLAVSQNGLEPIQFADYYIGPVNTGRPSGIDLNQNGSSDDLTTPSVTAPTKANTACSVLSRFSIDDEFVRTFQTFLWRDMPWRTPAN